MFGFRNTRRPRARTLGGANLQRAAIVGAGMLALRWWRNRRASSRAPTPGDLTSSRGGSQSTRSAQG
jgi:hypothetical protein